MTRVCSEDNCDRCDIQARGLCNKHYESARYAHTLHRYELMYDPVDRWTCECASPVLSALGECASCFRPPLALLLARLQRATERDAA